MTRLNIPVEFFFPECTYIMEARNEAAAYFLEGNFTHLLWIDSDIGFLPQDALRLLGSDYPLCGANYVKRNDDGEWASSAKIGLVGEDGFASIAELPNGFMCVKREVFEAIKPFCPIYKTRDGAERVGYFNMVICPETGELLTEDYAFCWRWRAAKGAIYVDVNTKLTHQGSKLYSGDFAKAVT